MHIEKKINKDNFLENAKNFISIAHWTWGSASSSHRLNQYPLEEYSNLGRILNTEELDWKTLYKPKDCFDNDNYYEIWQHKEDTSKVALIFRATVFSIKSILQDAEAFLVDDEVFINDKKYNITEHENDEVESVQNMPMLHYGFKKNFSEIMNDKKSGDTIVEKGVLNKILEIIKSEDIKDLYCVGHSSGASLLAIFFSWLYTNKNEYKDIFEKVKGLYSYGSPKVGNAPFIFYLNYTILSDLSNSTLYYSFY